METQEKATEQQSEELELEMLEIFERIRQQTIKFLSYHGDVDAVNDLTD